MEDVKRYTGQAYTVTSEGRFHFRNFARDCRELSVESISIRFFYDPKTSRGYPFVPDGIVKKSSITLEDVVEDLAKAGTVTVTSRDAVSVTVTFNETITFFSNPYYDAIGLSGMHTTGESRVLVEVPQPRRFCVHVWAPRSTIVGDHPRSVYEFTSYTYGDAIVSNLQNLNRNWFPCLLEPHNDVVLTIANVDEDRFLNLLELGNTSINVTIATRDSGSLENKHHKKKK